tara:strand:+ start:305 stop:1030 length:726 start_codon:yes stop_codon:yes gene_type:complete
MNINSFSFKLILATIYLAVILIGLYFLFSVVDLKDLTSYGFIRSNKNVILHYKNENFLFLTIIFFIFSVIWILLLGFATPLLLFSGFVFGLWWGIIIVLIATTVGASLLYILVGFFFRDLIKEKLAPKFLKLKEFFRKNDVLYFTGFRFVGGGGVPYAIQNVLPILFNMPIRNYVVATFIGSAPSMFVTVSLGSGIEKVIDQNAELTFSTVIFSPEIYIPITAFFFIIILAFIIRKLYFKN